MKILLLKKTDFTRSIRLTRKIIFLPATHTSQCVEDQFMRFKDRKGYLVVSNVYFFDFLEFNSVQEVQDTFYVLKDEEIQNISEEQAKEIFGDVEKDFLQVHEILINKGLY